jgi:pSer/pThr/pTyr-binding forkhead associated (FHA) protein
MTAIPLDLQANPFETTEALDALDHPAPESGGALAPPLPGRYLAIGHDPRLLPIPQAITHIGRGFGATLQLDDASVSRRHAIVLERRGTVRILDDRSANGTFVNGRRVLEAELHDGDTIQLGRIVLMFVEVPAAAQAA